MVVSGVRKVEGKGAERFGLRGGGGVATLCRRGKRGRCNSGVWRVTQRCCWTRGRGMFFVWETQAWQGTGLSCTQRGRDKQGDIVFVSRRKTPWCKASDKGEGKEKG